MNNEFLKLKVNYVTEGEFESLRYDDVTSRLRAGQAYAVTERRSGFTQYGYTPDGEGVHWADTLEELLAEWE
jgi:hypothetical protein